MTSLLITNDFPPIVSGIATYFYQIWRRLPEDKVMVFAPKVNQYNNSEISIDFKVIRHWIPIGESNFAKIFKMLFNFYWGFYLIFKYNIKKLHCGQILSNGLLGLVANKIAGIPYVVYVCGSESVRFGKFRFLNLIMKYILANAEKIVINSESTLKEYLSFYPIRSKYLKITPGVDVNFFKTNNIPQSQMDSQHKILLTVSRLDERKGHDKVIAAMPEILKIHPDTHYIIVGEGREKERLKTLTHKFQVENNVKFTEFISKEKLREH